MKKFLFPIFLFSCALCGYSEPLPADDILAYVRTKLPADPIKLTGTLKVRTQKGFTQTSLPVEMELNWGAAEPTARYRIGEESLEITWNDDRPSYCFSNDQNEPTAHILDTGITWADLSFSVLWWPGSQLVDEEKKINRECYVVDVPVPDSDHTMRLWIEKKMGMLLEAHTLDAKMQRLHRMKIKSIKKMEGMWVAKDLEVTDQKSGNKTTLQITGLEWEKASAPAFDPAESVNQLAFDLYKKLSAGKSGNLLCSPYSVSSALAMVYGGARGETAEQMNAMLHFGEQEATHPAFSYLRKKLNGIQKKGQVQLNIANSLWPQKDYTFLPDYLALTQEFYGSEIEPVDYKADPEGARKKINGWVEDQTADRIKNLIPEDLLNPLTRLVLANAIYFKGDWARQFDLEQTRPAPFKLADGTSVEVPMMSQNADFQMAFTSTFLALELPYKGNNLSMTVLLPRKASGLPSMEKALTLKKVNALEFHEHQATVDLPRFKFESTFQLGDTLAAMGMPLALSDRADFSGMDGSTNLFIGEVVHKAFVEVNEKGTQAAAATGGVMQITSVPMQFTVDHPFLFLIRENSTGAILFIGRVMDPR